MSDTIRFALTCFACPEQYDVYDSYGNKVGYVRLRHGFFSYEGPGSFTRNFNVTIPIEEMENEEIALGDLVNDHDSDGIFTYDQVRDAYLRMIARRISYDATDDYEIDRTTSL